MSGILQKMQTEAEKPTLPASANTATGRNDFQLDVSYRLEGTIAEVAVAQGAHFQEHWIVTKGTATDNPNRPNHSYFASQIGMPLLA